MKNLRDYVLAGLLLAMGLVLHYITPSTGTPVKPDFLLSMLFVCLLIFDDISLGISAGVAAGILSGLTTSVPGGLLPNIIDKLATTIVFIGLIRLCKRYINQYVTSFIVPILGTIFSGSIFLTAAIVLGVFPPETFIPAFITAVLPATVGNVILVALLFSALRQTGRIYKHARTGQKQDVK